MPERSPRESNDELRRQLKRDLLDLERTLTAASLAESLRLIESPRFDAVTEAHVREVAEYRSIVVAGERFFERAWSRSKEAGAMLGFARLLGARAVSEDLRRLHGAARDPADDSREREPRDPG